LENLNEFEVRSSHFNSTLFTPIGLPIAAFRFSFREAPPTGLSAIGQFINYRTALKLKDPDRKLFLAIPDNAYDTFFQKEFPQLIIQEYQLELFVYDIQTEVIQLWLP